MNKEQKQMAKAIGYLEGIVGEFIEQEWIDGGISKKTLYRLRWLNKNWRQN